MEFIDRKDLKVGDRAYFFNHPKPPREDLPEERPFPYQPVRKITIRNLRTASGKQPRLPDGYTGTEVEFLPDTK